MTGVFQNPGYVMGTMIVEICLMRDLAPPQPLVAQISFIVILVCASQKPGYVTAIMIVEISLMRDLASMPLYPHLHCLPFQRPQEHVYQINFLVTMAHAFQQPWYVMV
jgi:hypothetical protein